MERSRKTSSSSLHWSPSLNSSGVAYTITQLTPAAYNVEPWWNSAIIRLFESLNLDWRCSCHASFVLHCGALLPRLCCTAALSCLVFVLHYGALLPRLCCTAALSCLVYDILCGAFNFRLMLACKNKTIIKNPLFQFHMVEFYNGNQSTDVLFDCVLTRLAAPIKTSTYSH